MVAYWKAGGISSCDIFLSRCRIVSSCFNCPSILPSFTSGNEHTFISRASRLLHTSSCSSVAMRCRSLSRPSIYLRVRRCSVSFCNTRNCCSFSLAILASLAIRTCCRRRIYSMKSITITSKASTEPNMIRRFNNSASRSNSFFLKRMISSSFSFV